MVAYDHISTSCLRCTVGSVCRDVLHLRQSACLLCQRSAINRQLFPASQTPSKARGSAFPNTPSKDRELGGRIAALSSAFQTISIRAYRLFTFRPAHLDLILSLASALPRSHDGRHEEHSLETSCRGVSGCLFTHRPIARCLRSFLSASVPVGRPTTSWRSGLWSCRGLPTWAKWRKLVTVL